MSDNIIDLTRYSQITLLVNVNFSTELPWDLNPTTLRVFPVIKLEILTKPIDLTNAYQKKGGSDKVHTRCLRCKRWSSWGRSLSPLDMKSKYCQPKGVFLTVRLLVKLNRKNNTLIYKVN